MPISFPSSPSNGQTYTAGTKTWEWNGTAWVQISATANLGDSQVTTAKIADGAITAAKIADGTIVAAELAANAVTQAKLASNLSGITITTSTNVGTDIPSPITSQFAFFTDTNSLKRWDGSAWATAIATVPTGYPTSVTNTASTTTTATFTFTFDNAQDGGSAISNYQYNLSTDGGTTYGDWAALSPADYSSPITISGLSSGTDYYVKLRAVNALGPSGAESAAASFTTLPAAPTSLAATVVSSTSISVSFSQTGTVTNYQYALSTDGGSTYGSFAALSPADAVSPITISGLTANQTYYVKLKAVNSVGVSAESAAVSVSTTASAPTSLASSNVTTTAADISFTQSTGGGSLSITNYKYALSTDSGSTYGSYTTLSPADSTSPLTITGLSQGTAYYVKLRAITSAGDGEESSAVTLTTVTTLSVDYLVIAGGGGGGGANLGGNASANTGGGGGGGGGHGPGGSGGGGGAGGYKTSYGTSGGNTAALSALSLTTGTSYSVSIGAGGSHFSNAAGARGTGSTFSSVTTTGGGGGGSYTGTNELGNYANLTYRNGGSGGGADGPSGFDSGGSGVTGEGFGGGSSIYSNQYPGGGGGGAGGSGGSPSSSGSGGGSGGAGLASTITGSSITRAAGGQAGQMANGGAAGGGSSGTGCLGGSGVVILRYPNARTITLGAGLTGSTVTDGSSKVTTITAGTGNVSWS